jgi:zinc protease
VVRLISKTQARIVLGYPGVTLRDADRFALDVLAEILGGAGGRLEALRARQPSIDSVGAASVAGVDPGYFAVRAAVRPDLLDAAVPALRAELAKLIETGVTADEVATARRLLMGRRALALERRGAVALSLALRGAFGETGRSYRGDVDDLGRVTADDVARVARRILDPRREVLAVVRPQESPRESQRESPRGSPRESQREAARATTGDGRAGAVPAGPTTALRSPGYAHR